MGQILWIEDEADRLPDVPESFSVRKHDVLLFSTPKECQVYLLSVGSISGPIVLDLCLPSTMIDDVADNESAEEVDAPQVGLRLLRWLQSHFGMEISVFIVSGNVDLDVRDQLTDEFRIPVDRVFEKPLNDDYERLINNVANVAAEAAKLVIKHGGNVT